MRCEAIPNTDGGRYAWRCTRVEAVSAAAGAPGPAQAAPPSFPAPSLAPGGPRPLRPMQLPPGAAGRTAFQQPGFQKPPLGVALDGKYNVAPPPMTAYTAQAALASAAAVLEGPFVRVPYIPLLLFKHH